MAAGRLDLTITTRGTASLRLLCETLSGRCIQRTRYLVIKMAKIFWNVSKSTKFPCRLPLSRRWNVICRPRYAEQQCLHKITRFPGSNVCLRSVLTAKGLATRFPSWIYDFAWLRSLRLKSNLNGSPATISPFYRKFNYFFSTEINWNDLPKLREKFLSLSLRLVLILVSRFEQRRKDQQTARLSTWNWIKCHFASEVR